MLHPDRACATRRRHPLSALHASRAQPAALAAGLAGPDSPAAFLRAPASASAARGPRRSVAVPEAAAQLYLQIVEESDYAERLAPVIGGDFRDVLDVGAGNGALTRRCLGRPARWLAVEPGTAQGEALARLRPGLAGQGIDFAHLAMSWQRLPAAIAAETVFSFNLDAAQDEARALFDNLAGRCRREMIWVVPAQAASSLALTGLLPPELQGGDRTPPVERTLAALAREQQPNGVDFVDWTCRLRFNSRELVARQLLERLDVGEDSGHGRAIIDYLDYRLGPQGGR